MRVMNVPGRGNPRASSHQANGRAISRGRGEAESIAGRGRCATKHGDILINERQTVQVGQEETTVRHLPNIFATAIDCG